ncbi:hypothetical protein DL96DRAFT_885934 [Flagelloscypha sp. PMI_526]|nr:hypothetical protein DL96DRAFT_885934 [Flagelloscypha sp. PMI_526]
MAALNSEKPLVLVVGITGRTGSSIARALVESKNFRVAGLVRPESLSKPLVKEFEGLGVEIRSGTIDNSDTSKLDDIVKGVDILVITVLVFTDQKPIILAAKRQSVKRVVPSEFGPPVPRGRWGQGDIKADIRDFIHEQGIGYTFISIGWWAELLIPYPRDIETNMAEGLQSTFFGDGTSQVLWTSKYSIGDHVALILNDPRTQNKHVIAYDGSISLQESWNIATKITNQDFSDYPKMSLQEVESNYHTVNQDTPFMERAVTQAAYMLFFRQDSSLTAAKEVDALNGKELYPEYEPVSFEDRARAWYEKPTRLIL